jgi:hypothetical protein
VPIATLVTSSSADPVWNQSHYLPITRVYAILQAKEVTMQLGETIATYDVGLALRGETGKFEVTSPAGEIYLVTCKPDCSISNLEWSGNTANSQPFLIRKVAEPLLPELTRAASSVTEETPAPLSRAPFLVDNREEPTKFSGGVITMLPDKPAVSQKVNLELMYLETDPVTQQHSASVCLRGEKDQALRGEKLTFACKSFIELDAEIRRLHAQLDEIRYQARKKFYKAQAAAASA